MAAPRPRTEEEKDRFLRGMAWCNLCENEKPRSEFSKSSRNWNGLFGACKECSRKRNTSSRRLNQSGWTQEEYDEAFRAQNGLCAICGLPDDRGELSADHCHVSFKKRKLLCRNCNQGLGFFKDDPSLLKEAMNYLMEED